MSTTSLLAGEVMDRSAVLMNDPSKTDYTYDVQLPYLNMAIDALVELLEESNVSPTNDTSAVITIPLGTNKIVSVDDGGIPSYPSDLIEIQEVGERAAGSSDPFLRLGRREFLQAFPPNNSLLFWIWENQEIKFNPNGALTPREIQLRYVKQGISQAADETSVIGTINARSYLSFKTAALCSMFIGENQTRAGALNGEADIAVERMTGISNKGRQQIMTRHRPFRAGFKSRGW
jgi:hypothetical protein